MCTNMLHTTYLYMCYIHYTYTCIHTHQLATCSARVHWRSQEQTRTSRAKAHDPCYGLHHARKLFTQVHWLLSNPAAVFVPLTLLGRRLHNVVPVMVRSHLQTDSLHTFGHHCLPAEAALPVCPRCAHRRRSHPLKLYLARADHPCCVSLVP